MARVLYIDRQGNKIDQATYKSHLVDDDYAVVRQYDNGKIRVTLNWIGRIENPQNTFPEYYKNFILKIQNYDSDGNLRKDPASDTTFANEGKAIAFYEDFLTKWSACQRNENGEFVEVDNSLTPPPPPDPNKPTSAPDDDALGGVGAW